MGRSGFFDSLSRFSRAVLTYFLIFTFFGGIGYQLRRWLGRQRWYVGVGFVLVLYVPGFVLTLFGLVDLGMSFEAARRFAVSPVLGGLAAGAFYLCGPEAWLIGLSSETENPAEEDISSYEIKGQREKTIDEQQRRRWSLWGEIWDRLQSTRERVLTAVGVIVLLGGLAVALQDHYADKADKPQPSIDTREVPVQIPELPVTAILRVPTAFTPASSALEKAKQRLILNTGETRSEYSQVLSRDWGKEFGEMAILSIGQLSTLKDSQGKIPVQKWRGLLEKARTPSQELRKRVDSLQSRLENRKKAPGYKITSPTATVRNGSIIAYMTVQVAPNGEPARQLTARKIMYDSGYSVLAEVAITVGSDAPMDSLQKYVGAISFSAE